MEWKAVYYNGLETNVEVTRCGKVRKVNKNWLLKNTKNFFIGEIDFTKLKLHPNGYQRIGVNIKSFEKKVIQIQQLVAATFLNYKFGNFPNQVVDHIDSNTSNNNIDNLRVISHRENMSKERTKKSGLPTGVYFYKRNNNYCSQISINKKRIHLGYFNTIEEASNAYKNKLVIIKNKIK
jgi:hypothetical protein